MDFEVKVKEICEIIQKHGEYITTEETTKTSLILPFLRALGYNTANPSEVSMEFTADVGSKKGEKVDIAVYKDRELIFLIECKPYGCELQKSHTDQLFRYFSVTDAKIAILTNGEEYEFYSDLEKTNRMDPKPFFEFDICEHESYELNELKKFVKEDFSLDDILGRANELKYTKEIKKILERELTTPSEAFVRFFVDQIYGGRKTRQVIDDFTKIVLKAREQFIEERISDRFKAASALSTSHQQDSAEESGTAEESKDDGIVTTQDEVDGYNIIKAILYKCVDVNRVVMRDTRSYCGILLDDNNRKPICRLIFNNPSWLVLALFYDGTQTRARNAKAYQEKRLESVNDIYKYADIIRQTVREYDEQK